MPAWLQRDWCSSFVLALGHFLWQGTLISIVLAIALRATKTVSVRYWLSLVALLVMAVSPVVTLGWLLRPMSHIVTLDAQPIVREEPAPSPPIIPAGSVEETFDVGHVSNVPVIPPIAPLGFNTTATIAPPVPADDRSWWQKFAPHLTTTYLCGVALMLLRLVFGLWGGRRLRRRVHLIDDPSLLAAMQRQATALGLKLLPVLAYCERVTVPTVVGVLKPMILLPLTLTSGLSPEQMESVLAHELAHLRRYDHLVNLLQRVIESLLFFHPALWWVSHRIRDEREHCCDDLVVACGAMPLDYAKSLLVVAELSRRGRETRAELGRSVAAVSLLATGHQKPSNLRQRIARLLGESAAPSLRLSPRVLTMSAVVVLAGLATLMQLATSDDQISPTRSKRELDQTEPPIPESKPRDSEVAFLQAMPDDEQRLVEQLRRSLPEDWVVEQRFGAYWIDRRRRVFGKHFRETPDVMLHFAKELDVPETPPMEGEVSSESLGPCRFGYCMAAIREDFRSEWPAIRQRIQSVLPMADPATTKLDDDSPTGIAVAGRLLFEDGRPVVGALVGPMFRKKSPLGGDGRFKLRVAPEWSRFRIHLLDANGWPSPRQSPRKAEHKGEVLDVMLPRTEEPFAICNLRLDRTKLHAVKLLWKGESVAARVTVQTYPSGNWLSVGQAPADGKPNLGGRQSSLSVARTLDVMLRQGETLSIPDVAPGDGTLRIVPIKSKRTLLWNLFGDERDERLEHDPAQVGSVEFRITGAVEADSLESPLGFMLSRTMPRSGFGLGSAFYNPTDAYRLEFDPKAESYRVSNLQPGSYHVMLLPEGGTSSPPVTFTITAGQTEKIELPMPKPARSERQKEAVDSVDVSVSSSNRAGRGSPDPTLDPTEGLPNSKDETNPTNNGGVGEKDGDKTSTPFAKPQGMPPDPARLRVHDARGSKALFNDVVKATVGFPKTSPDVWLRSPNREGIVSLDGLPVGTHWLLAAGNSPQRLPFQITIPTEQPLLQRRLRSPAWLGKKVELAVQPVVEVDEQAGEVIVIEILNQSHELLSFSEADLVLLCELPSEKVRGREWIRGLSPKWLTADREPFPQTKIEAGQTGRMRLNWREWVRQGLWSSRNHETIAEPGFPPNEPGKIWVKAGLGNGGSLPVSVTDPKAILPKEVVANVPDADAETSLPKGPVPDRAAELELFTRRLRAIAPQDWIVERKGPAFRLLGPEVPAGKDRAQILLWFDEFSISSDNLAKRDKSLPKINALDDTRLGCLYFDRNSAAEDSWPEFGLEIRLIEPVDRVAIASTDVLESRVIQLAWFDAAFVRNVEIGSDGRRRDQLLNLDGSAVGITPATKFLVVGKLPDSAQAKSEADKQTAQRHLETYRELRAEAAKHGVRTISLTDFETYAQAVVKEGRGSGTRWVKDANKLQVPDCLLTGRGLEVIQNPQRGGEDQLRTLRKPALLLPDHWIVQAVGFDNGGKELVTASNQSFITIRRWDVVGMKLISEIKLQADKHGRAVRDGTLMFSGDRRRVIAATDAYVGIWETATGKLLTKLPIPKIEMNDTLRSLTCTPDFSVIVGSLGTNYERTTLVYDAHTVVWDGTTGKMLRTLTHKNQTSLIAMSLSPDGKRLATTNGGGASIWDTSTGQWLLEVTNDNKGRARSDSDVTGIYSNHVWSIQLSPDGKQLAMGDTLGVKLLDATSGKLLQQLEGPYSFSSGRSPNLVFSKDGHWLARLGTGDKVEGKSTGYVVPIWSTQTGQKLFELHTEANDAAFSDDGQRLAVVFSDMQQALSVWPLGLRSKTNPPISRNALASGSEKPPTLEPDASAFRLIDRGGEATDAEPAGPGPHSRQDRVEENGHYVGKTAAEFIDKFQPTWGNEKLGLQYGIALTKPQPQRKFRSGERVPLVVFFRNASDKPIKFDTAPDFFGNTPKVLNAKGEPIALENIPLLGHIPHYHEQLAPGEALGPFYLNVGLGENPRPGQQHWHPYFKTPVAGQYKLTYSVSINVASPKDGEKSKSDQITSGQIEFEIIDGDKPVPNAQANKPAAAIVDTKIGEPKPDASKRYVATLPEGRSVEFVGLTKYTRPVNEGWSPDGSPLGIVGNWPPRYVLHHQDRWAKFDEKTSNPTPDADAIDFLLRFSGLKAQPSINYQTPTLLMRMDFHQPVKAPHELRGSARWFFEPPLGTRWAHPAGVWRIGLTDEPWGRFVKINPEGKVLDPIQPNDRHASTYKLIEVLGTKAQTCFETGTAVVLREPESHADPANPRHMFDFQFRAIDTDGEEHSAEPCDAVRDDRQGHFATSYGLYDHLPAGKTLSHYEYRLRPYRYWITFENVATKLGEKTVVKVKVETLAVAAQEVSKEIGRKPEAELPQPRPQAELGSATGR